MQQIDDATFGRLTRENPDDDLEGSVASRVFNGSHIGVTIECKREKPRVSRKQRLGFEELEEGHANLREQMQEFIFQHYKIVRQNYLENVWASSSPEVQEARIPNLVDASGIWNLISDPRFYIPEQDDDVREVSINFNATWDPEHSVRLDLEDGEVVGVETE
jgi:hypothetical protein